MELPAGLVTFLFTDIVGSSARWDRDAIGMETAIALHDDILERAIEDHGGVAFKKTGDGVVAAFADPADAVRAAVRAQLELATADWPQSVGGIEARMGIHTGPAEPADGDYLGPTVNRAARLEAAAHGGQILVSAASREVVADRIAGIGFNDLGEHRLRGLTRPERVYQVTGEDLRQAFPPLQTESVPTNLPAPIGDFVGRERELEELSDLLGQRRLLTITGVGGAGKTSLAIEAARREMSRHPSGVWLLELATLTDPDRIPTELLGVIGKAAKPGRDHAELALEALAFQHALLVLDNCEHLVAELAQFVSRLLGAASRLTVLATSREALRIRGEQVWEIPPMTVPLGDGIDDVRRSDAGALFTALATSSEPEFELSEHNAATIARICRRLEGLPLAIELAAARIRSMTVTELDGRLEDRLSVLRGGARDQVPHHRTLRDTIDWSYELLASDEQRLYRALSVFVGSFDLEAVASLTSAWGQDEPDLLEMLDHLIAQSLVIAERREEATRYRMLETIREHARERAVEEGEAEGLARAHLDWLAELVRGAARALEGPEQEEWLTRLRAEIGNIRAGLRWALANDLLTGAEIVSRLTRFFWMYAAEGDTALMPDSRSFLQEGYEWGRAFLDGSEPGMPDKLRARLQMGVGGLLCVRLGRYDEALSLLADASKVFEQEGDLRSQGWATFYRGIAGWGRDDSEKRVRIFRRALDLHTEAGDRLGALFSTLLHGHALALAGRIEEARSEVDRFSEAAQRSGIPTLIAHASDSEALLAALAGAVDAGAIDRVQRSLTRFREMKNYACLCHALGSAGLILATVGDIEGAGSAVGLSEAIRQRLNMVVAPYEDRSFLFEGIVDEGEALDAWKRGMSVGRTFEPDEGIDWTLQRLSNLGVT